jgi:hypothetical protein
MARKSVAQKIHNRMSADLPINARVSIAIVTDPYSGAGEKIQVLRSVRDDPLAGLLARNQIDNAQFEAGRMWQLFYERSEVGHIRAIDPTKEAVDGGRMPEPITDRQIAALRKLDEAHKWLGNGGYEFVFTILGKRKLIKEAAEIHGFYTARELAYFGKRFQECLESLACLWGLVDKPVSKSGGR